MLTENLGAKDCIPMMTLIPLKHLPEKTQVCHPGTSMFQMTPEDSAPVFQPHWEGMSPT